MKVINNYTRKGLVEGRSTGFGFAFAKRTGNTATTVMPASPCKDYLNDALYAEVTGKLLNKIYGFLYEKVSNIIEDKFFYLVISGNADDYSCESIKDNYKNIQFLVNSIERQLKIKDRTVMYLNQNKEYLVVKAPKFWASAIYLISFYTLVIRAFQRYDKVDKPDLNYLIEKGKVYSQDNGNCFALKKVLPKLFSVEELPKQPFKKVGKDDHRNIHNYWGVLSYLKDY